MIKSVEYVSGLFTPIPQLTYVFTPISQAQQTARTPPPSEIAKPRSFYPSTVACKADAKRELKDPNRALELVP